ncbi:MAG: T9SS type A sorting domain-containing protein [Candidatus Hatepunaea meridiana]|nr:T9SS type A sorting domain-containing protein [Candidatus Hatepunaea meridiana]
MKQLIILSTVLILLSLSSTVNAQDSSGVTKVAQIYHYWSGAYDVITVRNTAYVSTGSTGIGVVLFTDNRPAYEIGYNDEISAYKLARNRNHLFTTGYTRFGERIHGMFVLTLSNSPEIVGICDIGYPMNDIEVEGDYAYVSADSTGLIIIDISDPENPEEVSTLETDGSARRIALFDDYACIADGEEGLIIVDISDPEDPEEVIRIDVNVTNVTVDDDLMFLSDGTQLLRIYDISDPEEPEQIGEYETERWYWMIEETAVFDEYVIAITGRDIHIINISDPEELRLADRIGCYNVRLEDVYLSGDICYIASQSGVNVGGGILKVDISNPQRVEISDAFYIIGYPCNIDIYGNYAFLTEGEYNGFPEEFDLTFPGVNIFNISNPRRPSHVCHYEVFAERCIDVEVVDDIMYLTAGYGMKIVDVSRIDRLRRISSINIRVLTSSLTISGDYAYIGASYPNYGLYIVDISDPEEPQIVSSILEINDVELNAKEVKIVDDIAYIATHNLILLDISNPEEPEVLEIIDDRRIMNLDINDDYAFITTYGIGDHVHGLWVLDISEPENPQSVVFCETEYIPSLIVIEGNYAILTSLRERLLRVWDISDPEQPEEVGHYIDPNIQYNGNVAMTGTYALVPESSHLGIYNCSRAMGENSPPRWTNLPGDTLECIAGNRIAFGIDAEDPDEEEITLEMICDELPDSASFIDRGDGTGNFTWRTGNFDSGEYLPRFIVSDGDLTDTSEVLIIVHDVNESPEWVETPPDTIEFEEGDLIELSFVASDNNDDFLEIFMVWQNQPDSVRFQDNGDGSAQLLWQTTRGDAGIYQPTFLVYDEDECAQFRLTIIVNEFTGIHHESIILTELTLDPVYPNPFNSTTTITYTLPTTSLITLNLFNLYGQRVRTLFEGFQQSGIHTTILSANSLSSGLYFVKLEVSGKILTRKVMLIE